METKIYYHLLEQFNGKIARQNYYLTELEAEAEKNRLKSFYPEVDFFIEITNSKKEPFCVNH